MRSLVLCLLLVFPSAVFAEPAPRADWVGEAALLGSLNPEGLAVEGTLSRRIDLADRSAWLTGEAHLDLGVFASLYPVGYNAALRLVYSPLLFLDIGCLAGIHGSWEFYEFATPAARYGPAERKSMEPTTRLALPYVSPFLVLKAKVGPVILYNSCYLEKWFHEGWWFYWYPEALTADGWLSYLNSYLLVEVLPGWRVIAYSQYLHVADTGEEKWLLGGGLAWEMRPDTSVSILLGRHLKEPNYRGFKISCALSLPLAF